MQSPSNIIYIVRLILLFLWLTLVTIACFFAIPFFWRNSNLNYWYARSFGCGALKILNWKLSVSGIEHLDTSTRPKIFIGNHQSNWDLVIFSLVYPRNTISMGKVELLWFPFWGQVYAAAGNILVHRKNKRKAVDALKTAKHRLQTEGVSVWLFPEGTRNRTSKTLLPFKRGAFVLASETNSPIIAIAAPRIEIMHRKIASSGLTARSCQHIQLTVLPPLIPHGQTQQAAIELLHRTSVALQDEVEKLSL